MDWKKAKSILIFAFFVLNIVLLAALYDHFRVGEISAETISNTRQILEQNNILLECPIPKYTGKDYILEQEEQAVDKKKVVQVLLGTEYSGEGDSKFENGTKQLYFPNNFGFEYTDANGGLTIYTDTKSGIDLFLKELSKKLGIPFNEFKQDGYYPNMASNDENDHTVRVVYKGTYKGYDVFDNYIDVDIRDQNIISIRYQYKKPKSITHREINVIPAYEILITKITNYPGIIIRDVDLGFKGYLNVDQEAKTLYEGLAWRIKTVDGKGVEGRELYYNARTGEEIN